MKRIRHVLTLVLSLNAFLLGFLIEAFGQTNYSTKQNGKFIEFSNYKVHYVKEGSGKPLVLVHGGATSLYTWRKNIEYLAKYFTVYAIDMPGHGNTISHQKMKYNLNNFADFIHLFLTQEKLEKVSLVGNSWGGGWAVYFAEKFPEKLERLILIDASGFDVKSVLEWQMLKYPLVGEVAVQFLTKSRIEKSYTKIFYDQSLITEDLVEQTFRSLQVKANKQALYKVMRHCDWKITQQGLSKIKAPTLIIWGNNDQYLDKKLAYRFKNSIAGAEVMIIDKCGHLPHEERPEVVNEAIAEFIMH